MKKRLISWILIISMVFTMLPVQALAQTVANNTVSTSQNQETQNPFSDVKESDWYYKNVMYALENDLFAGISDKEFNPQGTMTRGMYVTVLGRMAEIDSKDYDNKGTFADVSNDAWYAPYVEWAVDMGITSGSGENTFEPNALVTREQMAAFTVRYFEKYDIPLPEETVTNTPKDFGTVADYAKDAVLKLWYSGMLQGDAAGNFNPKNNTTRAEAATFCGRTDTVVEQWFIDTGVKGLKEEVVEEEKPKKSSGGSYNSKYSVSFYDGDRLVDTLYATKGQPLGEVPTVEDTSKANAIFLGWFIDEDLETPYYAENDVTSNMKVYGKYSEMGTQELITPSSFAQMDQGVDFELIVKGDDLTLDDITLTPKDGSDVVPLKIADNNNGTYTVTADGGYNEGASYEATLADDDLVFVGTDGDLPDSIRTASFSIEREEAQNIQMSENIEYVKMDASEFKADDTFTYAGDATVEEDQIFCFYKGEIPTERDYSQSLYEDDPEIYFKAESVSGNTVTLADLDEKDAEKLYNIPDNFPLEVATLPTGETGTVDINELDTEVFALMIDSGEATVEAAKEELNIGDFITMYTEDTDIHDASAAAYVGKVTAINCDEITYTRSSNEEIESSMDLYVTPDLDTEKLITDVEKENIENTVKQQVLDSGFAEEAAFLLADMATATDGFRENAGVKDYLLTGEDGKPLTDEEIELLDLGASFELKDGVTLTVELITDDEKTHFANGVQLAIGIDAQFEVEVEDEGKIVIDLSATFIEEVELKIAPTGKLIWGFYGLLYIPKGVHVTAVVDVKNFTAVNFNIHLYTVAPEDENLWEQLQDVAKNPEKLADVPGMPDDIAKGLKSVGDAFDKIEEVKAQYDQAKGTAEQIAGYAAEIDDLWKMIEATDGNVTRDEMENIAGELGQTSITADLMGMLNMTTETGLENEYMHSMDDLMAKYNEMLEEETDWVTLMRQKIGSGGGNVNGIAFQFTANFVVRMDANIVMGTNIEYEIGKRYNVWFKVGLLIPDGGSTSMDLIDERFAFQFYVMGKLGLKMGVEMMVDVGIGSTELASVGVHIELGPYVKLYGFFIYEYEKTRPANTTNWIYEERMAGALYMEFGLYFVVGAQAQALQLFETSYDFVDEEVPLLKVGESRYPYAFDYRPAEDETVLVKDEDNNSSNGITMVLPEHYYAIDYVDLDTGYLGSESHKLEKYNATLSNKNFTFDKDGEISVKVPDGVQYMECDLTFTYLHGKLAFSDWDMSVTIPLVWTNLSTDELNEYYTATVRVGNVTDGYETVWSDKVLKNEEVTLPTEDEIKKLIGYNDAKYDTLNFAKAGDTVTLVENKSYDVNVAYDEYRLTVSGIENEDGSTTTQTFTAKFGEAFDFSDLETTGTEIVGDKDTKAEYTKFTGVTTEVTLGDDEETIDLTQPLTSKVIDKLASMDAKANYVDDSVKATFTFNGIEDADAVTQIFRKGETANFDPIEAIVANEGLAITEISPALSKISSNTTYTVTCGELTGEDATITFEENGGDDVADITKVVGSLIGTLPTSTRTGYTFVAWYTDETLETEFTERFMADNTVYAKWTADEYTVTFNVNGGNALETEDETKKVTYGEIYGELPEPTQSSHGFTGWNTEQDGTGDTVTDDTDVDITEGITLYAQWIELEDIPDSIFDFGAIENTDIYATATTYEPDYTFTAEADKTYTEDNFTFKYKRQGDDDYIEDEPINAGTYDVNISRPADNTYAKFDETYTAVLTINKADRTIDDFTAEAIDKGYNYLELKVGGIDDLHEDAVASYTLVEKAGNAQVTGSYKNSTSTSSYVSGLVPNTEYYASVSVTGDPNYNDASSTGYAEAGTTAQAPTESWSANVIEPALSDKTYSITSAEELAWIAQQTNSGKDFTGYTIKLENDIDLYGRIWTPIGATSVGSPFLGTFDGNDCTISGMYVSGEHEQGLFGWASDATIKDLTIKESYVKGSQYVGGIAGQAVLTAVSSCVVDATVEGTSYVGGIVGYSLNTDFLGDSPKLISDCVSYGKVYNTGSYTGGIVGYNNGVDNRPSIQNCVNFATIWSDSIQVGGIVGCNEYNGQIVNNANLGTVKGTKCVGGIVGENKDSGCDIYNNYNAGSVKGTSGYVGAVCGRNNGDDGYVDYCYWMHSMAYKGNTHCQGLGTSNNSTDSVKGRETTFFHTYDGVLSRDLGYGKTNLITALNAYASDNDYSTWTAIEALNGAPIPTSVQNLLITK